jgi:hypothetical protein
MEHKQNDGFSYTYSAQEQTEIRKIREKYTPQPNELDKMERLRQLDARVTRKAQIVSLTLGVIGVLILGFGMSLIMSDLSEILGIYQDYAMLVGILIGIVGGASAGIAYPIYNFTIQHERKKIAPEILRLTDELLK